MDWDLVWAVVGKDFKEFRRNKFVLYSLVAFPLIFSIVIPLTTVGPFLLLEDEIFPDHHPAPPPSLHLKDDLNATDIDAMRGALSENETLDMSGYRIDGADLERVFISDSRVENATIRTAIISNCILVNVKVVDSHIYDSYLLNADVVSHSIEDSWGRNVSITLGVGMVGNEFAELDDPGALDPEFLTNMLASTLLMTFVILPSVAPTVISSYSVIGEKKAKSLEPMLATPLRDSELLTGKIMASFIPTMAATYCSFVIFTVLMHFLSVPAFGYNLGLSPIIVVGVLIMAPLVCLLSIEANVLISSKVNDVRAAQQLGALVVLPLILVFLVPMMGLTALGPEWVLLLSMMIAFIDVGILWFNLKVFNRENILVKWS